MASALTRSLADLMHDLGDIPLERVRMFPSPGTANEQDVLGASREDMVCELIDGVLVEKAMGYRESILAIAIATALRQFVVPRNLGHVSGADGMMRLFAGLVRIPDVAFASWDRFPDGKLSQDPVPNLVPDLAVEVLSQGNTAAEMDRKRSEYFDAGVRLLWLVDPEKRVVTAFTSALGSSEYREGNTLDGADLLPEFRLNVSELFSELDRQAGT